MLCTYLVHIHQEPLLGAILMRNCDKYEISYSSSYCFAGVISGVFDIDPGAINKLKVI